MNRILTIALVLRFPFAGVATAQDNPDQSITITRGQLQELIQGQRDRYVAARTPHAKGGEVGGYCVTVYAACATAAAAACIFECTTEGGTTGPVCTSCVDGYADTCAAESGC